MRARPEGIDDAAVTAALAHEWQVHATACAHVPAGGGSHHWRVQADGGRFWATVDDLTDKPFLGDDAETVFEALTAALEAACALAATGLDSVAAPIRTSMGKAVARLDLRYAIALYPYLDGTSYEFGQALDEATAGELADILAHLHSISRAATPGARPLPELLPGRRDLETALAEVDVAWAAGPDSERARAAVKAGRRRIEGKVRLLDEITGRLAATPAPDVLTHGEPHPGNLMRAGGRLVLVDWDTLAVAAPERDLWWLEANPEPLARYEEATGRAPRPDALRLFNLRWQLDDIASFVRMFRAPHVVDADTERWIAFGDQL